MVSLLSKIKSVGTKVLDTVVTTYSKPLAVTKAILSPNTTVKEVVADFRAQPIETQKKSVIKAAAGYSAALVGAAVAASATAVSVIGTSIKAVLPTAKSRIIATVAAPVVVGAVIREPAAAAKTIVNAPSELAQFGGDIAQFAANPSLSNAKQIIAESPVISGVAALAGVTAVGAVGANAISGVLTRNEMEKQTEAFEKQAAAAEALLLKPSTASAPQTPITPATAPLIATAGGTTSTTGTKRRRYTKQKPQQISQRVNIIMSNKSTSTGTKNYLNKRLLAY